MTVREVVWMCRQQKGMTMSELAERVGMKQSNLSRLLSGRSRADRADGYGDTKVSTLIRLLEALDAQIVVQTCRGDDEDDEFILDGEDEGIIEDARDSEMAFSDV